MGYQVTRTKKESLAQLEQLLGAFEKAYPGIKSTDYKEAQLRIDFINPLLKTFGWDVDNEQNQLQFIRDVIQEETVSVEQSSGLAKKNPDYTLRVQGRRKLFVEAKKLALDIVHSPASAFQTRRYGWSAGLGASILTNFEQFIVYDCRYKPESTDSASVARYQVYDYKDYLTKFDELYELLSYESVAAGALDTYFSLHVNELSTFDAYFLLQIETWRQRLADELIHSNTGLLEDTLNLLVQRLLNRIVFLRICEDRELEDAETLKHIQNYEQLKALFIKADKKYNSGLFNFIEDHFSLKLSLQPQVLIDIFNELYYPESPYDFSVVDPSILSQIYERYLGSKVCLNNLGEAVIVEEPEVAASSGVVPTPKAIVDNIVQETLLPIFSNKTSTAIFGLKIADICCGSGTFLLAVYDTFIVHLTIALIKEGKDNSDLISKGPDGTIFLTLKAKQHILLNCIYGVDINPYAVEVTMFSLYIKLLENEYSGSIQDIQQIHHHKLLPDLGSNIKNGNSLVDDGFFKYMPEAITNNTLLLKLRLFNWLKEFPFLKAKGGFDAIVGNPPYVRIQNLVKYQPEETAYYQNSLSGYAVVSSEAFDKYYLFIERAISLLHDHGVLGYIVPHRFFIVRSGANLRELITAKASIQKIIHFGVLQVFPGRSTYTTVLIIDKTPRTTFGFTRIHQLDRDFIAGEMEYIEYSSDRFGPLPWLFISPETIRIFEKMRSAGTIPLSDLADIPVGLQTSRDHVYIFRIASETATTYRFVKEGTTYEIEKSICMPCLHDRSFSLMESISANAQMIYPYTINGGRAEVMSEVVMEEQYPLAWKYLNRFKTILEKRSIIGSKSRKWYQYGRPQSLTRFHNQPKLIWPVLSLAPNYIYDLENLQFTGGGNGPYYALISTSIYAPLYFLGLLTHPILEAMVKAKASMFRGGYYSHGRQFLAELPIRNLDLNNQEERSQYENIVGTVRDLIDTHTDILQASPADTQVLKRKYEFLQLRLRNLINAIYKIDDIAIATIISDGLFLMDIKED
jgi:type I restriction-modification system DNA methylase subunit